ncbi:MAG: response regulator [Gammaproteobacteria bacterium]|nr:response regulator [Gammaproteobacteria bacterium]
MSSMSFTELSILLIEPSYTQRKIILTHLQQEGVKTIDGVATAEEALAFIEHYPPDLVISAMYLPDGNANDLFNSIRNSDDNINFMLISSETHFAILDPIRQAGVVAILPKPFDNADLNRALRATLDYIDPEELELSSYDVNELRVLLVDDSLTARNHIKRVLNNLGITGIETAQNGSEAVQILDQNDFDLVITDLNMPEMDGQQLVEYIRQDLGNTFLPILVVTSAGDDPRFDNIQQAGVSAICDKPFEPQSIKEVLYRIIEGD